MGRVHEMDKDGGRASLLYLSTGREEKRDSEIDYVDVQDLQMKLSR